MTNFNKTKEILNNLINEYPHDEYIEKRTKENNNLKIIGITGSNGKTTVSVLVHEYLKRIGKTSVLFSSKGIDLDISNYKYEDEVEIPIYNETSLINALNGAIKERADYLILEINERTIEKGYVKNIPFFIRALTNIIPKHNTLQYTEEEYVELKKSFFKDIDEEDECTCIYTLTEKELLEELININNKEKKIVASEYVSKIKEVKEETIDYMLHQEKKVFDTINGLSFNIKTKTKDVKCNTNMIMPFNALNITLAYGIIDTLGEMDDNEFNNLIKEIVIEGRDEVIKYKNITIIITITCTPHLEILKRYKERKEINNIILVTGSFGNGFNSWLSEYKGQTFETYVNESMKWAYKYFTKHADKIYITTNDYANSDVKNLLTSQEQEIKGQTLYSVIEDRKEAIKKAIDNSNENDVIVISGRGNRKVFCKEENKVEIYLDKDIVIKEIEEDRNANKIYK